jgi:hypothetical protein
MLDVVENYDPDFIYTDGSSSQPFSGYATGSGYKCDAMQRVISHFYNRTLERHGKLDTLAVVKFHGGDHVGTTFEGNYSSTIKEDQPWFAEFGIGDWFWRPGISYDNGGAIVYRLLEAISRDGAMMVNIPNRPDGALDSGATNMLANVGQWMNIHSEGIYGSRAWVTPTEGSFRFTVGTNGCLYAFYEGIPSAGTKLTIASLATSSNLLVAPVTSVSLLGSASALTWSQTSTGLVVTLPATMPSLPSGTAIGLKISPVKAVAAPTGTYYYMQNRTSGLVIDSKGSTSAGSQMGQWAKVNSSNLKWQLVASDSGYYYIQNQTSGLYLDGGGYTTNGAPVKQWSYDSSANLQWQPVASDSGYYYLKNRTTGLCLDGGGATANGAAMKQWCYVSSATNLQWSFQPVDGTYKLISENSGLALETPGQHDANGQQIDQYSYYGGGNQQWTLTDTGSGVYKLIGVESGRSLDINGGSSTNGTVVQIYDYASNKNSQQFKLTSSEVGQFRITPNCATGSCLDVYGASTANGGIVNLWQWNGGANQQWSFRAP